jgi:hypothetical protein
MKPRTKYQKRISELVLAMKNISKAKLRWIEKNQFWSYWTSHYKNFVCTECNHQWRNDKVFLIKKTCEAEDANVKCPNCNKLLRRSFGSHITYTGYGQFIDRIREITVVRIVQTTKILTKNEKPRHRHTEISRLVFDPKEEKYSRFSMVLNSYIYEGFSGEIEFRGHDYGNYRYKMGGLAQSTYPYVKLTKYYKRAGIEKLKHSKMKYDIKDVFYYLMFPPFETLLKLNLIKTFFALMSKPFYIYWPAIKIAIRHGYSEKAENRILSYLDYLKMLYDEGKDLHNPKYVCPEDIHASHQQLVRKQMKRRERERIERQRQRCLELEKRHNDRAKKYADKMKKFEGIVLQKGDLVIVPIMDLDTLQREGAILVHCVYTNAYDEDYNKLLLSARYKGEVVETVAINIHEREIDHARGFDNKVSSLNSTIVKLVNENMDMLCDTALGKLKKRKKEQVYV